MKVQTIQKISCNFRQKIQNFSKKKIYRGPDSVVVEPHFLRFLITLLQVSMILRWCLEMIFILFIISVLKILMNGLTALQFFHVFMN